MTAHPAARLSARIVAATAALVLSAFALTACATEAPGAADRDTTSTTPATDSFPMTIDHKYGQTVIDAEPQRVVVVGLTEQDILLQLGVIPVATTEWYGEQPYAVWPWAQSLLGDAQPTVLSQTDGLEYEKIAAQRPDLIVGINAGMTEEMYAKLATIAPTITGPAGSPLYFTDWQEQTRLVARAVGRSAAGEAIVADVEKAYAEAAAAHPEFAGLTATFSQGTPYDGHIYVYPDGMNTDFLTDLGFTILPGLEQYAAEPGQQARIAGENMGLVDADVMVFATETEGSVQTLLDFGTVSTLTAVTGGHTVFTDPELAGAIYFLTPLSQKYVLEKLVPRLVEAVAGTAPQNTEG